MVLAAAMAVAKSGFLATPFERALGLEFSDADAGFFFMQLGGGGRVFAGPKHRPPANGEQMKFSFPGNFNIRRQHFFCQSRDHPINPHVFVHLTMRLAACRR
jgi:hypothetical protein